MNNEQLHEMALAALENWLFDVETDPDGTIRRGLEYLAYVDILESVIDEFLSGPEDWIGLDQMARGFGQQQ